MRTETPPPVKLVDYRPFPFKIEDVRMLFQLHPTDTRVVTELTLRRTGAANASLKLDGEKLTLKGLRIASGWSSEVKRRLAGARSCTHVMELLIPMATTAFQSLTKVRRQRPDVLDANGKPTKVDSCYAYAAEREIVPLFYDRTPEGVPVGWIDKMKHNWRTLGPFVTAARMVRPMTVCVNVSS